MRIRRRMRTAINVLEDVLLVSISSLPWVARRKRLRALDIEDKKVTHFFVNAPAHARSTFDALFTAPQGGVPNPLQT